MDKPPRDFGYADINVGDKASLSVRITETLVDEFAKLSGDMNPLHMDEKYASGTPFGGRIAHGMIVGALFSRLIGMQLPGRYSLYLSQSLQFRAPIAVDTEITVSGQVVQKTDAVKTIAIRTIAEASDSKQILVSGEALVQLFK
jgi:3-hydroxybutyryl-CoA dehydratase